LLIPALGHSQGMPHDLPASAARGGGRPELLKVVMGVESPLVALLSCVLLLLQLRTGLAIPPRIALGYEGETLGP